MGVAGGGSTAARVTKAAARDTQAAPEAAAATVVRGTAPAYTWQAVLKHTQQRVVQQRHGATEAASDGSAAARVSSSGTAGAA